jgi:hypothetical protein
MTDLSVANHGSIFILTPHTDAGRDWVDEHIPLGSPGWGKDGIVVEHRYIGDIVAGAQSDGLSVE